MIALKNRTLNKLLALGVLKWKNYGSRSFLLVGNGWIYNVAENQLVQPKRSTELLQWNGDETLILESAVYWMKVSNAFKK